MGWDGLPKYPANRMMSPTGSGSAPRRVEKVLPRDMQCGGGGGGDDDRRAGWKEERCLITPAH